MRVGVRPLWASGLLVAVAVAATAAAEEVAPEEPPPAGEAANVADAAEDAPAAPDDDGVDPAPEVLFLHTYFFPYADRSKSREIRPLVRELPRQAALITARHEFGLETRDETLGEIAPAGVPVKRATISEKAMKHRERCFIRIVDHDRVDWRDSEARSPWKVKPDWQGFVPLNPDLPKMYASLLPELEKETRGKFVKALQAIGLKPPGEIPAEPSPLERGESLTDEWHSMLMTPDHVLQWAVVNWCHEAIAEQGETEERLGALVRGYANLAVLTNHQWNCLGYAYGARALLYAQRLVARSGEEPSDFALWHRAYAWGLVGIHNNALADLQTLADRGAEPPDWAMFVEPYCRCSIPELQAAARETDRLKPWSLVLQFNLALASRYPQWIDATGRATAEDEWSPYLVYAQMSHYGRVWATRRFGAAGGRRRLGRILTRTLSQIDELEVRFKGLRWGDYDEEKWKAIAAVDPNPNDGLTPVARHYVNGLRAEAKEDPRGELCWSALAYLIEEELFVQVAVATGYFRSEKFVNDNLPLLGEHRYAKYIESYKHNIRTEEEKVLDVTRGIVIRDCRGSMAPMTYRTRNTTNHLREDVGNYAWATAPKELTMLGILEKSYVYSREWDVPPSEITRDFAKLFGRISPHSEIGARMLLAMTEEPSYDEVVDWDDRVDEDPDALRMIADFYMTHDEIVEALRCYEESLARLHEYDTAVKIAEIHHRLGQDEEWENLWIGFLGKGGDTSDHNKARLALGHWYSNRAQFEDARRFAVDAAEAGDKNGVWLASYACEALGEWDESEMWSQQRSYDHSGGHKHEWFFWCCRTGRGDRETAEELADEFFSTVKNDRYAYLWAHAGYELLRGEEQAAYEAIELVREKYTSFAASFLTAQQARRQGDEAGRKAVLDDTREFLASDKFKDAKYPGGVSEAAFAILYLLEATEVSAERIDELKEVLFAIEQRPTRAAFAYLVACELDRLGRQDAAVELWRRALRLPGADYIFATLAGHELAKRFETSRDDDDLISVDDVWGQDPVAEFDNF